MSSGDRGGVVAVAGDAPNNPMATSNNNVDIRIQDCPLANNQNTDFVGIAARTSHLTDPRIAGINNNLTVELHGSSSAIDVKTTGSIPLEDDPQTNFVTVLRTP